MTVPPQKLRSLSEIRQYFYRNERPIYYVDDTNFHLLGIDEWVRRFQYVNYSDPFDGKHPNVLVPERKLAGSFPFDTLEQMNNFLLQQPSVVEHIRSRGPGKAIFLYFDEETIRLCEDLDLEVCFPPLEIRRKVDDKVEGTRIGERAGVPSVPNVLGRVEDYAGLKKLAAGLGDDLVIQTPYGDSGATTYFVSSEEDFAKCAASVAKEAEVKVMKRIRCRSAAIEACVTRAGTIVGPLMTEIIGFSELTPYRGGWAGNEAGADTFPADVCAQANRYTESIGAELSKLGYRGYFEIDYLIDADDGSLYLGEFNPRITGASSMTNLAAFAHADAPLFLFHLLEYEDVDFELDVAELNRRWSDPSNVDGWSQLIIKHTKKETQVIGRAPPSGVWRMDDAGDIQYVRSQIHRRTVDDESEAFFFRIAQAGDLVTTGEDIGILVARGRLQTPDHQLTERAKRWIAAVRRGFVGRNIDF